MTLPEISAQNALNLWRQHPNLIALDVRAPQEFAEAMFPKTTNAPLLDDGQRHQIGLTYKESGQQAAIDLGWRLVGPQRAKRTQTWLDWVITCQKKKTPALLFCWRGGLRSSLSQQWISEGLSTLFNSHGSPDALPPILKVSGGYKALRGLLLNQIDSFPSKKGLVLGGATGSGKTDLIHKVKSSNESGHHHWTIVDLEAFADHKGSAFGRQQGRAQPTQTTFENQIGFCLSMGDEPFLIEDESHLIGRLSLPLPIRQGLEDQALIVIDEPLETRVQRLATEYATAPIAQGLTPESRARFLLENLGRIQNRLGGLRHKQIALALEKAFYTSDPREDASHYSWIQMLLEWYYDPLYEYSTRRRPRTIAWKGNWKSCLDFLLSNSHKR